MKTPLLTVSLALCALALPSAVFGETVTAEPDAFLEYVEADGNQYIDTGVNAETGLKARLDFEWGAKVDSNDDWSLLDAAIAAGLAQGTPKSALARELAARSGRPRGEVYDLIQRAADAARG